MDIRDVINRAEDMLYDKNMVLELCDYDISEYQRGIVQGRINMLNWIKMMIEREEDSDEDSSVH